MAAGEFQQQEWPPKRQVVAELISTNLASLSFFWSEASRIGEEEALKLGSEIEDRAFQAASGNASHMVKRYVRLASEMMLEALGMGMKMEVDGAGIAAQSVEETCFDISAGERVFLNQELARKILKPLSSGGYTRICFSNKSFGRAAAEVAAELLSKVKTSLSDVNLADIVAGRPEAEALEVMELFSKALEGSRLRSLNLSDNALGEKGVRAFSALLKSQHALEELSFLNNGISKEAARAICELVPTGSKLTLLHFHNNMTGDEGAKALAKLVEQAKELESFRFSSTRVCDDGAVALASALCSGSKLKVLDLRDNLFDVRGGTALGKALKLHGGLTHVYLSDLDLKDHGTIPILSALASGGGNLVVLELGNNELTDSSAGALVSCIRANKLLTKLNLSENELGDKGAVVVCKEVKEGCDELKELDLSSNSLSRVGAIAAADAVVGKTNFTLLNIDGNRISGFGLDEVRSLLKNSVAGIAALGPLDDNDEDGVDEDDGEDEDEDEDENDDENENAEIEKQMKKLSVQ